MTDEVIRSNVIQFPREKLGAPPESLEEAQKRITEVREGFASDFAEHLWGFIYGEIERAGGDLETNQKEISFSMMLVVESIKSLYLHTVGTSHPIQDVAKQIFSESVDMIDKDEIELTPDELTQLIEETQNKIEEIQTTLQEHSALGGMIQTIKDETTLDNTSKVI